MKRRWFGPKLGSGRGLSALIGGVTPASWQGWVVVLLFLGALIGAGLVSFDPMTAWIARGAALVIFLVVAILTYGRDPN